MEAIAGRSIGAERGADIEPTSPKDRVSAEAKRVARQMKQALREEPTVRVTPCLSASPNCREEAMRLIAIAFALALASAAQAMPIAPIQQPDSMVTTVREACGAGMHMVNGKCLRTPARRAASRCVRGKTC
jgi:hypothetical protein